jgi:hypothetical protein
MLFRCARFLHTREIQDDLEPGPRVIHTLIPAVEPLELDALALMRELTEAGIIANNTVVVPLLAVFGLGDREKLTRPRVAPYPRGEIGE